MAATPADLKEKIRRAAEGLIETESRLVVRAYGVIHSTEDFMRDFVRKIMERFQRSDLSPAVEIIMKELTMNAVKANFKKIFFLENNLNMANSDHYTQGMARFGEIMDEHVFVNYGRKAREAQLSVETSFDFNKDRVIIEVRNNAPMAAHEELRARQKLEQGFNCEDLMEFFTEGLDESEGAGAGLVLCMTTMRSVGLDPRLLSVYTDLRTETVARVEIPLHPRYVPNRAHWQPALAG